MLNIQEKIPLAPLTSFRIGGQAQYYAEVKTLEDLKEALLFAKEKSLPYYVLAGGTNLLISDSGFAGLIVRMKINEITINVDGKLEASAGVPLIKVINFAAENGLSGIEALAGVPGTFGGAVRGNAGAYGTEVGSFVLEVSAISSETLGIEKFKGRQCDLFIARVFLKKIQI